MKKRVALVALAAFAVLSFGIYGVAGAEEAVATDAAAVSTTPAPAPAATVEKKDLSATVTGTAMVKTEMIEEKEVKVPYLTVLSATGKDGMGIASLKGKTLKVTGAKVADVEKLAGKKVEAKGVVKEAKTIDVLSVAEVKAATEEAAPTEE